MVDIRDFFGNKKSSKRKAITIDDDDIIEVKPTKILKTVPKSESKPKPKSKSKNIDNDFIVEDLDEDYDFDANDDNDDDDFLQELSSLPEKKQTPRASRNKSSKDQHQHQDQKPTPIPKSPIKKSPQKSIASPKKNQSKPTTTSTTITTAPTGITAWDVLSKIPDAILPEDIPTGEGSGFNFRDFKARQQASAPISGNIEIPEGAPNCLTGLTIVFTGVLPNISRDDCENIAKKYGAKVTKSISSKTSLVVLGEEAGPSKVKKIKQHKIKAIDENGFIQLIKGMPEEGGDGDAAEKARLKRQQEEEKALEESLKLQKEADDEIAKRQKLIEKSQKNGSNNIPSKIIPDSDKLWTVRYAPTNIDQICGNKSTVQRLKTWLENWQHNFGGKKPIKGETELRAVLISGPPGIGKTTAAHLVAKSLGYDVLEKNASDVRSKSLLNQTVGGILDNTSVVGFFKKNESITTKSSNSNKFCIIMDEVDGMSGGDRGGVGQLASFCRITQAPLILICNDKSLPKMRPFDRVTIDLPFRRPSAREMKSRLMTIALREKIKLDPNIIDQLVAATSNDIRQIINLFSTVSKTQKSIDTTNSKGISSEWQKNIALKPFDIIPRLLSGSLYHENSQVPLYKKIEYYFDDHAFVPLMLQENYLNTRPSKTGTGNLQHLEAVANAAESISLGDLVDSKIHSSEQQWSLMPLHAVLSTVRPASYVAGQLTGRVNFAAWLGQNSKTGKYARLLTELQYRSRLTTGTDQTELRLEYIPILVKKLLKPLLKGADYIPEVIDILDHYYLSKTDFDFLMEFPIGKDSTTLILKKIPTTTKSKFTRKYNSSNHPVAIFHPGLSTGITKQKKDKPDFDDVVEDDEEEDD